ncbi:unnamed protein product [Phytophthora lilii]|uniref:Unnamed protein product n=1 Tax=Phytophthora lilii TaxID=2077276 RepID=A0A9W7CNW7_9STRA|nr:unnamed protein product [Phytophthora lilii]
MITTIQHPFAPNRVPGPGTPAQSAPSYLPTGQARWLGSLLFVKPYANVVQLGCGANDFGVGTACLTITKVLVSMVLERRVLVSVDRYNAMRAYDLIYCAAITVFANLPRPPSPVKRIRFGPSTDDSTTETVSLIVQDTPDTQCDVKHFTSDKIVAVAKTSEAAAAPAKILFLDGIRGLAALLVVTQHSHEYLQDLNLGACAVDAFFVLSSFLLTMLFMKKSMRLLSQRASYRKWAFTLADYFSRRFFRVYPLFALVAIVLWMLPDDAKRQYYLIQEPENFDLHKVLTFDFDSRYFVLWTLPLEISYYFFIPVFVLVLLRLRSFWWAPFVPMYGWVVYEGWYTYRWDHMELLPHAPTFLTGSMAAVIFVKVDEWIKASSFKPRPYPTISWSIPLNYWRSIYPVNSESEDQLASSTRLPASFA